MWAKPKSAFVAGFLGLGNLLNGEVVEQNKFQTAHGIFTVTCKHKHSKGDKVHLLARPLAAKDEANFISGLVVDVIFQQDRFKVTFDNGLYVYLDEAPKNGQKISVPVKGRMSRMKTSAAVPRIKVQKNPAGVVTYQYEGGLMARDENSITLEALFDRADMPFQDVIFKTGDRFVEYYYSDRWYNIFEIYDRDHGQIKGWYCNVGMPAVVEEDAVSYVDLALDLWVSADGRQTMLDEDNSMNWF